MKLPNKPIESATVFFSGEPGAGIRATSFDIELFIDLDCYAEKDRAKSLENIREKIAELYQTMAGEIPGVLFDFELSSMVRAIGRNMGLDETLA